MARFALFCLTVLVAVALTCAQLGGLPPSNSMGGMGGMGSMGMGQTSQQNPWNWYILSRMFDMNPFLAMMLGGQGGGNMMWPYFFLRGMW